ncbi:MAG: TatD family hydrolase [Oscillospiraceae bacterium]|nr:TatD family hydrolase [Oscillospiraceae bacterium]
MYFDTHAHYCDKRFNNDRDELLESMPDAGVSLILNSGSSLYSSDLSIKLADKYPFIYASAGIHPHDSKSMNDDTVLELKKLLAHPKAVAVGEIGLDYHYDFSPRDIQKKRFREQLELARSLNKPVIIHEREALQDTLNIVRDFSDLTGVFHCFSGSWETAKIILDLGWYLSFTGVITFKNARKALEVLENMPADRIMLETDCPYLAPDPKRGTRNSSLYLPYIAQKVAEVRGESVHDIAELTMDNGKRFFGII